MIAEKQRLFHTTSVKVATALLTLGFQKLAISRMKRSQNRETVVFWFSPTNAEGITASSVCKGMTAGADVLMRKDPENVINYLRCALANRDELIADIHNTPRMIVIEKDGRTVAISENASEATKKSIADMI